MAVSSGIFENTYNNYLASAFHISPETRGNLEFIREFPGLLNVVFIAVLAALPETRVAAFGATITAVGMAGFGFRGESWRLMLLFTLFWGAGSHILMPIRSSLSMSFGGETKRGRRLGQVGAVSILGSIVGAALVWLVFGSVRSGHSAAGSAPSIEMWRFDLAFYLAAAACIAAAAVYSRLRSVGSQTKRPTFVFRTKYWLYYVLNVLFGARKQVFLTFGRWVLVTVFGQSPSTFAKLWIIGSVIGLWFTQAVGRLVDRLGERTILIVDSFVLLLVCAGYAVAQHLGLSASWALIVVCTCFVVDQLFFAVGMARDTYMSKISETPEDLTASLSVGVTINHLVAMSVPSLGGRLWEAYGYEWVFVAAGGLALLMMLFASMVRVPKSVDLSETG
jgi:MFS family permease